MARIHALFFHVTKCCSDTATYHVRTSPGLVFEGVCTLLVSRVRAARQLLVDWTLLVEMCTASPVDRWRVVGKQVLISKIVAWFVVEALAKPSTTNCHGLVSYLTLYSAKAIIVPHRII